MTEKFDRVEFKRELMRDVYEHEVFLSFYDDEGAEVFEYFWNEEGAAAFKKYFDNFRRGKV